MLEQREAYFDPRESGKKRVIDMILRKHSKELADSKNFFEKIEEIFDNEKVAKDNDLRRPAALEIYTELSKMRQKKNNVKYSEEKNNYSNGEKIIRLKDIPTVRRGAYGHEKRMIDPNDD